MVGRHRFVDETTFHGIKEIVDAVSIIERLVWIVTMIGALGMMIHGLMDVTKNYLSEPVASQIEQLYPKRIPDIIACPQGTIDETKAQLIGLDFETTALMLSYSVDARYPWSMYHQAFNSTAAHLRLTEVLSSTGLGLKQLFLSVSRHPSEVIPKAELDDGSKDIHFETTQNMHSMCVAIQPQKEMSTMQLSWKTLNIEVANLPGPFGIEPLDRGLVSIYFGKTGYSVWPMEKTKLIKNQNYEVQITVGTHRRANLNRAPCREYSQADQMLCYLEIAERKCSEATGYSIFIPGLNQSFDKLGNYIQGPRCSQHVDMNAIFVNSDSVCWRPCEQWVYQSSIIPTRNEDHKWNITEISFGFSNILQSWKVTEINTATGWNLVHNAGGSIALWSGASILTVFHLMFFCFCKKTSMKVSKAARKHSRKTLPA